MECSVVWAQNDPDSRCTKGFEGLGPWPDQSATGLRRSCSQIMPESPKGIDRKQTLLNSLSGHWQTSQSLPCKPGSSGKFDLSNDRVAPAQICCDGHLKRRASLSLCIKPQLLELILRPLTQVTDVLLIHMRLFVHP